jgi:hypothetical protein
MQGERTSFGQHLGLIATGVAAARLGVVTLYYPALTHRDNPMPPLHG